MSRLPYRWRLLLVAMSALLVIPLAYAVYQVVNDNLHVLDDGALYRAGQMSADELEETLVDGRIRTVLNLRGPHPEEQWYRAETAVAAAHGVRYVSIPISARSEPDLPTMTAIAEILLQSPGPILVHCQGGADRTGLVAAIYQLVAAGQSRDAAQAQLSVMFGHLPWFGSETIAMDRAFARFAKTWETERRTAEEKEDGRMLIR